MYVSLEAPRGGRPWAGTLARASSGDVRRQDLADSRTLTLRCGVEELHPTGGSPLAGVPSPGSGVARIQGRGVCRQPSPR